MALTLAWLYLSLRSDRQVFPNGYTSHVWWMKDGLKSTIIWHRTHKVTVQVVKQYLFPHPTFIMNDLPSAPPETSPMDTDRDVDDLIDNTERISTKVVEKTFDIKVQLPEEQITLAITPYKGIIGEGFEYLSSDLRPLTLTAAKMVLKSSQPLSEDMIRYYGNVGLSSSKWIEILVGVANNEEVIHVLSDDEAIRIKVIMCRLAHTPPNALFSVHRSSTDPTNASRAWSAAHLALGSWHAKLKKMERRALQQAAKQQTQATLVADKDSNMSIHVSKKKSVTIVSPDPKNKSKPAPASNKTNKATNPSQGSNKRPATEAPPQDQSKSTSSKKTKQFAKEYVHGDIIESRISYKFLIPEKADVAADFLALGMVADLLKEYQKHDPKVAILPWKKSDAATLHPLTDQATVRFMEVSKFRVNYTERFRPKSKQNCWFRMAIAHSGPRQHLLSGNLSNQASWFDERDSGAWLCTVQGSDDTVPVGDLLYGGPFLDIVRITDQIQQVGTRVFQEPLRFGCRISKNLDVPLTDDKPRNWMLAENQLVLVEADRQDVKKLKNLLYQVINKQTDFRKRPGAYNVRYLPDKSQVLTGTKGSNTRANTLRKHAAVIQSLSIIKSSEIKHLDKVIVINGATHTLRSVINDFTFPLCPGDDDKSRALFHSVDYPSSGPDLDKGIVYFTAYHDQSDLAERLVAILPAYIQGMFSPIAASEWFQPGALSTIGEVTFGYDDDGNWNGTWSTAEDELAQDILDEDMGIQFEFDNIPDIETQMVLLTTDEASVDTFGTALGAKAKHVTQQKESGIPAAAEAVAAKRSDGNAV